MHSNSNAQRGFTLMELMFTITVLAILLGLAVPSFLDTVRNNRLITQNNEFIGALNLARNEAWKKNVADSEEVKTRIAKRLKEADEASRKSAADPKNK